MNPGPRLGSVMAHLLAMNVGDRWYVEVEGEEYKRFQKTVGTHLHRRPEAMKGWKFINHVFTAVSNSRFGDVRTVVCVERTE